MKKITFILFALIAGTGFAQNTASDLAMASAGIVSTINITKTLDMNFGGIVAGTTGTVLLSTEGVATPDLVTLVANTAVSQAQFNVQAAKDVLFTVTVPGSLIISTSGTDGGADTDMLINTFTHDAGTTPKGLGSSVDIPVKVGATLNVDAAQAEGQYSGSFEVSVDYQ